MRSALALILLAAWPRLADCQLQPPVLPTAGARVRVTFADPARGQQTGVLVGLGDSVRFAYQSRSSNWLDTVTVSRSLVRQVEVSEGQKKHTVTGMLIGLVAGTAVVASLTSTQERCETERRECFGEGMVVIALPAIALGALIGSGVRTDKWRPVEF